MNAIFTGEIYSNIMGHTSEHLVQVIAEVKGVTENNSKGKVLFSMTGDKSFPDFYNKFLSCSIIEILQSYSITIKASSFS